MDFQSNFKQYLNSNSGNSQSENEKLTEKEMQDLQEAIDNSKRSIELEKQQRDIDRQTLEIADCFLASPKSNNDQDSKETAVTPKQCNKQRLSHDKQASAKKEFKITFQDLPKASDRSLDVLYHSTVFNLPININPAFQKHSLKIRKKLLSNYFTKLDKLQAKYARRSLKIAPHPKPILPLTNKLKNSTTANNVTEDKSIDEITTQTSQSLYVSRAGRQIKRKIYTEDEEIDSDYDISAFKKNKADDLDLKITLETPLFTHEANSEEKTPARSSKIKKDAPWRPSSTIKRYSNRSEEMFDKLKQDEDKRKQHEEEISMFVKSLNSGDDEENDPIKVVHEDETFERVRVAPPVPTRRGRPRKLSRTDSHNSSTSLESEKKNTKLESPPKSPILRRFINRGKSGDKLKVTPKGQKAKEEEASTSKFQKVACPICNNEFLQSEIENHASNCGIYDDIVVEENNQSPVKTISCNLCEKEFVMNSEFEVHVQHCIAAHVTDI